MEDDDSKDRYIKYLEGIIDDQRAHIGRRNVDVPMNLLCANCYYDLERMREQKEGTRIVKNFISGIMKGILLLIIFLITAVVMILLIY